MPVNPGGAPLTIADGIRTFAAAQPTVTAVIDGDRRLTYAELDRRSNRLANALLARGLTPGQTVAVLLANRLEYCEVAAGIAKAGLIMVPLNPRMSANEIEFIVEHSESRAIVVAEPDAPITTLPARCAGLALTIDGDSFGEAYEAALADAADTDPLVTVHEVDPFCISYTSGTTGQPRGVVISHRSRSLTFYASALEWNLGVGRRSIAVAPMYHGAGFAFGYSPVYTGGTVSMLRSWNPEGLLSLIEHDRAQSVFLVPTHAQMLRALGPDALRAHDLSSLDTLFFNAAALPTALKEWVLEAFPGVGVHELYGSTESGIISNLRPADAVRKPGSVGHAWFMTEVRVVDDAGQPVPPGEPGELFSRSPYLMNGYLANEDATSACVTDDGFITCGDIAIRDEEGYIYIVDRKKDVIITGGVNVYPREVEEVALRHHAVRDIAVVGLPDEKWGERVAAFVVVTPGEQLSLAALDEHVRQELAAYKVPRTLIELTEIPRNAGGKVLKRVLRDQYAEATPPATAQ